MKNFKQSVPADSLTFGASLAIDHTGELAEKPITITARTAADAYQGYWGRCVHDFAGFKSPTSAVPLDYNHNYDEVIGMASQFSTASGNLTASGKLVPFKPDDRASEVVKKGAAGIPYQASIEMDPDGLVVEKVPDGKTVKVNGSTFSGPGTIFREWGINGIAVCPYGSDSKTSVKFSQGKPDIQVSFLKVETMPDPVIVPVAAPEPVDMSNYFSRSEVTRFTNAFGSKGFQWLAEGKTFEDSARLFSEDKDALILAKDAELTKAAETIAALKAELEELKAKTTFNRGKSSPVPVTPASEDERKAAEADLAKRGSQFGRTAKSQSWVEAVASKMPK